MFNLNISNISLNDPFLVKNTSINLSVLTLLVGKNGSGKSRWLSLIQRTLDPSQRGKNTSLISEVIRVQKHRGNYDNTQFSTDSRSTSWSNYSFTEKMKPVVDIIADIFDREIVIKRIDDQRELAYYKKGDNVFVPINADGMGISNTVSVIEALYSLPKNSYLLIDELTLGLHPSVISSYLEKILEIANENQIQIIASTQDLACILYILGAIHDEDIMIYKTTEEPDQKLWITPIEKDSMPSRLIDFLGVISDKYYLDIFNEISN